MRFEDDPTQVKRRPVVIVHAEDDEDPLVVLVSKITSVGPKESSSYFDQFKVEITAWRAAGLRKASWVKTNKILTISEYAFKIYVGHMQEDDLLRMFERINKD